MADKDEILKTARDRLKTSMEAFSETRGDQLQDLEFFNADPDHPERQWPQSALNTRKTGETERPTLVMNRMPQHVRQVTNDQRQNRPSVKVIGVDDKADPEVAEVYDGMVRHIEYISNAEIAYDTACENQVIHGEGFWRILTDYCDEKSFDQDIKIGRIRNNFSVYPDPLMQDPCGEDMQWCLITEDISKEEYHRLYPNASSANTLVTGLGIGDADLDQWVSEQTVKIAEYFCYENTPATLNLYRNGATSFDKTDEDGTNRLHHGPPVKTRPSVIRKVKWYKINGYEVLDERDWLGKYIPVIRVVGNEFVLNGKVYVSGLVRNAKDAQRMYNYWVSQEAEMLALSPKAPFIGYAGQFEGYENEWRTANTVNHPYLQVNPVVDDVTQQVLPLPQRAQPPMIQSGIIAAKNGAAEDIKATTGQYDASLGMVSNERSGKAILARQKEGDVGTFHFVDNLARAIRYTGRQLVDLIPKIYDTERIARIIGEDGESKVVRINPDQPEAVQNVPHPDDPSIIIAKIFNPSVGKYDVKAVSGPGYATKRQEALEAMAQLLQGNPDLWKVAGDLFVKNMDWPGAQELAKRFQKVIDPKLLEDQDNPALQQAQAQMQQMAMELDQMHQMLLHVNQSIEARDTMIKAFEAQIKAYDAETKRISAMQSGMTEEQIHEAIRGTLDAMIVSGDLVGTAHRLMAPEQPPIAEEVQEAPQGQMMPPQPPMGQMMSPDVQQPPMGQ